MIEMMKQYYAKVKKWWKNNAKRRYVIICSFFLLAFVGTLGMGITHRYDKHHDIMPIGKGNELSGNSIYLTKRVYNPDKHLYRLDFYVTSDSEGDTNNQYSADKLSVKNIAPNDPAKLLPTKLIRVTPQYYVMYVEDVPNENMRTDITYKASFADGSSTGSGEEGTLKVYSSEEKGTKKDDQLTLNTQENVLKGSAIDYDMTLVKAKETRVKNEMKKVEESSKDTEKEIKVIQSELDYKVGEEKQQALERLDNLNSQLQTLQETLKEDESKLKEYDKQILLLKEQKTLTTGDEESY